MLIDLVDRLIRSSRFPCLRSLRLFALAIVRSSIRREPRRDRSCTSSAQLSLRPNLLVRKIHRDQGTRSRLSLRSTNVFVRPSSHSTGSFVSIIAIRTSVLNRDRDSRVRVTIVATELARSFQRDVRHNWTEQWVVASLHDGLSDRSSTIELLGRFEHFQATNLSQLRECNSASRDMLVRGGEGRKRRPLSRGLVDRNLTILVWQVRALSCNNLFKTSRAQLSVLQYLGELGVLKGGCERG
jgi:hypothetical protein